MRFIALPLLMSVLLTASPSGAWDKTNENLAVTITNTSEPVLCAEKDNVTLNFLSPKTRKFRIEANHPSYIGALSADRVEPDWTACGDLKPQIPKPQKRIVMHEDNNLMLIGYEEQGFWRDNTVPVSVGEKQERNLSLIQLWLKKSGKQEEILVIYPADGYWRIRPLAPKHLTSTAYGSSVLIGPVTVEGRPIVKLKSITFDPETITFKAAFSKGGTASIKVAEISEDKTALDISFDQTIKPTPFAAMRSMYVTEFNADAARIARLEQKSWREDHIMSFKSGTAKQIWAGRLVPSKHNTSAPDMVFTAFQP